MAEDSPLLNFYRLLTQPLSIAGVRSKAQPTNQLLYFKLLIVALRSVPRNSEYWCEKVLYRGNNIEGNPILQEKYENYKTVYAPGVKLALPAPTSTTINSEIAGKLLKGSRQISDNFVFLKSYYIVTKIFERSNQYGAHGATAPISVEP